MSNERRLTTTLSALSKSSLFLADDDAILGIVPSAYPSGHSVFFILCLNIINNLQVSCLTIEYSPYSHIIRSNVICHVYEDVLLRT